MSESAGSRPYVTRVHDETLQYVRKVIDENSRLRSRAAALEGEVSTLTMNVEELTRELNARRLADERLRERIARAESDSRQLAEQYAVIEQQNTNLANLYVASYQLHGTVDRETVLQVIQEIIANLVGSEEMAVFEACPERGELRLAVSNGIDPAAYRVVPFGQGRIGEASASGTIYLADEGRPDGEGISACVPLAVDGVPIGAIAVFGLLPQKPALHEFDREMFELLAVHASTALLCATLNARTGLQREMAG